MREGKRGASRKTQGKAFDLLKCHPESLTYAQRRLVEQTFSVPLTKGQTKPRRRSR